MIISNCVINLSPDKAAVFKEAYRVLTPGGKVAVSDMVTQGKFTEQQRNDMGSWAECVSGAEDVADMVGWMRDAGFADISVRDKHAPDIELADSIALPGAPARCSAPVLRHASRVCPADGCRMKSKAADFADFR